MKSRVEPSAQCRSSISSTTGASRPSRSISVEQRLEQAALAHAVLLLLARPARRGAAELREQLGERVARPGREGVREGRAVARDRAQRADDRRVRDLLAGQLEALADQDARAARARSRLELAQQAGLADAGLAAHERERRPAGGRSLERRSEHAELGRAADERGGGETARHRVHCRAPIARARRRGARLVARRAPPAGDPAAVGSGAGGRRSPAASGRGSGATEGEGIHARGSARGDAVHCIPPAVREPRGEAGKGGASAGPSRVAMPVAIGFLGDDELDGSSHGIEGTPESGAPHRHIAPTYGAAPLTPNDRPLRPSPSSSDKIL